VINLKWKFKQYLLKAMITILAVIIAINTYKAVMKPIEPIRIIQQQEEIADSKYIISEEIVMNKLKSKSQIVSMEQTLQKTDTFIDDSILGQRHTELSVKGKYIFGLNTKDIQIQHIDNNTGTVYLKLGKPVLISLDIPFDKIQFDKTQGFFRLAMDEKEEKKFYKAVVKNIQTELMKDKEVLKTANLMNQDVVENILKMIPDIKNVVFN
jgi:hypothetical protein